MKRKKTNIYHQLKGGWRCFLKKHVALKKCNNYIALITGETKVIEGENTLQEWRVLQLLKESEVISFKDINFRKYVVVKAISKNERDHYSYYIVEVYRFERFFTFNQNHHEAKRWFKLNYQKRLEELQKSPCQKRA